MILTEKSPIANSYMNNIVSNVPGRVKNKYQTEFEVLLDSMIRTKA